MAKRMTMLALALCAAGVLGGCMTQGGAVEDTCGANELQSLVGQPADSFDVSAWDGMVRVVPANGVVTMDHAPQRLNVYLDEARIITRISCG